MTTLSEIDSETRQAAFSFIKKVNERYDVAGRILFGSRARRNHRQDSDADIAIILNGSRHQFLDTKLAMADIAYDVLLETGVLIQPLPIWVEEWEHPEEYINPALLKNIAQEGIRL